jgi:putative sterol carrier protein
MPRYLSPEWVQAFNGALSGLDLTDAVAVAGRTSLAASEGAFAVAQVVDDTPEGTVRTVLTVEGGRAALALDPEGALPANVTIVVGYDDALSIARGQLDPADALAAGRVRVRGELAVLVAGQAVLNEAATLLGSGLADLTD